MTDSLQTLISHNVNSGRRGLRNTPLHWFLNDFVWCLFRLHLSTKFCFLLIPYQGSPTCCYYNNNFIGPLYDPCHVHWYPTDTACSFIVLHFLYGLSIVEVLVGRSARQIVFHLQFEVETVSFFNFHRGSLKLLFGRFLVVLNSCLLSMFLFPPSLSIEGHAIPIELSADWH